MDLLIDAINANPFTWNTLFTALSAFTALFASLVALYLGLSSRRECIVPTGHKIDKHTFDKKPNINNKSFQEVSLYNASQRKIRIQDYGYKVGKELFTTEYPNIVYEITRPLKKEIPQPSGGTRRHIIQNEATDYLPFYLFDGEACGFALFPGDYSFGKAKKNKRLYVYVKANEKIKRYYTGITLKKYLLLTENIKDKSAINHYNNNPE